MKKNNQKIVAIIQARMGSTRLPNKMTKKLKNIPILEWVLLRVKKSKLIDDMILATSTNSENDILESLANKLNIKVFRGSENNVLNRFYESAKITNATEIIRVCADNPLIDGEEIDNLIEFYFKNKIANKHSYFYNHIPKNNKYPDGLGAEIVSFLTLEFLEKNVISKQEREHSFLHIWNNSDKFNIMTFDPKNIKLHQPHLKFDIDTIDDFNYLENSDIFLDITSEKLMEILKNEKQNDNRNISECKSV